MIIRADDANRRELGPNPHAARWAEAHSLRIAGDTRHGDVVARMETRMRMHSRQAAHDKLQRSYDEHFESGKGLILSPSPGAGGARARSGTAGPSFDERPRRDFTLPACVEPAAVVGGDFTGSGGRAGADK